LCSIELPTIPIPHIPSVPLLFMDLREFLIAPLKAVSWNEYFTRKSTLTVNLWIINDYNYDISEARLKFKLIKSDKIFLSKEYQLNIPPSSLKLVKTIKFKFIKEMDYGEYRLQASIYDSKRNKISENDLIIYLDSAWKKISRGISRFFGIFKGYLAAMLGQEIQLKMFLNAFLKRYEKLAEKSYCLDSERIKLHTIQYNLKSKEE